MAYLWSIYEHIRFKCMTCYNKDYLTNWLDSLWLYETLIYGFNNIIVFNYSESAEATTAPHHMSLDIHQHRYGGTINEGGRYGGVRYCLHGMIWQHRFLPIKFPVKSLSMLETFYHCSFSSIMLAFTRTLCWRRKTTCFVLCILR